MPSMPNSRPQPLCFIPPNGHWLVVGTPSLMPIMPASMSSISLKARERSRASPAVSAGAVTTIIPIPICQLRMPESVRPVPDRGYLPAMSTSSPWPELRVAAWRDTYATLLLYGQIVGKIRLALTPKLNEWWNVTFYVTARGFTTSPMPYGDRLLSIDFDFIDHRLVIQDSQGQTRVLPEDLKETAARLRPIFGRFVGS